MYIVRYGKKTKTILMMFKMLLLNAFACVQTNTFFHTQVNMKTINLNKKWTTKTSLFTVDIEQEYKEKIG